MDRKRVIGEVASRHGVKLEEDDPAFLLVTMAEMMLKEAENQFAAATQKAIAQYEEAADRVQRSAGQTFAMAVRNSVRSISQEQSGSTSGYDPQVGPAGFQLRRTTLRWQFIAWALVFALGFAAGRV